MFKENLIYIYFFHYKCCLFSPYISNEDKNLKFLFVLFVWGLIVAKTVVYHLKTFAITYSLQNYVIKVFL